MKTLILFLILTVHTHARADIHETATMDGCLALAAQESATLPAKDVVYAFDIDNTVLKLNQHLGSVHWFRWQQSLIQNGIEDHRVAHTIDELLSKQGFLYYISRSQEPEPHIADRIHDLQKNGFKVLYHTSRNPDMRGPTERDLNANRLLPLTHTIGPDFGYPGEFTYPNGPTTQRLVTFQNGIYMSAGQNKGIWLTLLLQKTGESPKHIVFVDDELKNLENVENAFKGKISTTLCRYGKVDDEVTAFNQSDKKTEINHWNKIANVIDLFN